MFISNFCRVILLLLFIYQSLLDDDSNTFIIYLTMHLLWSKQMLLRLAT